MKIVAFLKINVQWSKMEEYEIKLSSWIKKRFTVARDHSQRVAIGEHTKGILSQKNKIKINKKDIIYQPHLFIKTYYGY